MSVKGWKAGGECKKNGPLLAEFWPRSRDTFRPLTRVLLSLIQDWRGRCRTSTITLWGFFSLQPLPWHWRLCCCHLQKVPMLWQCEQALESGGKIESLGSSLLPPGGTEQTWSLFFQTLRSRSLVWKSLEATCTLPLPPRVFLSLESLPICRTHCTELGRVKTFTFKNPS